LASLKAGNQVKTDRAPKDGRWDYDRQGDA